MPLAKEKYLFKYIFIYLSPLFILIKKIQNIKEKLNKFI